MEKYRRVPAAKEEVVDEGVVRVQVHGKIVNYVSYASGLLEDESKGCVQIVGRGRAINKVVTVAEVIRRKIGGVHQLTALSSVTVTDRYEPIEEGLEPVEQQRTVSCITIDLARGENHGLDTALPGYSAPLCTDEAHLATDAACASMDAMDQHASSSRGGRQRGPRRGGGRSGRGGRGNRAGSSTQGGGNRNTNEESLPRGSGQGATGKSPAETSGESNGHV